MKRSVCDFGHDEGVSQVYLKTSVGGDDSGEGVSCKRRDALGNSHLIQRRFGLLLELVGYYGSLHRCKKAYCEAEVKP